MEPLSAKFQRAARSFFSTRPPAHTIGGFEHEDGYHAGLVQVACGGKAQNPSTYNYDVVHS